jgi:heat shock protein 5
MFFAMLLKNSFTCSNRTRDIQPIIAIDFGTTAFTVAAVQNGIVQNIQNELGHASTPSVMAFIDGRILIGEEAVPHLSKNPRNTIFAVKRLISGCLADRDMQDVVRRLPYKVLEKQGHLYVEIEFHGFITHISVEQLIALFLSKMKTTAETHLATRIKGVVLTVPLSFGEHERQAMKAAAEIAGLEVIRFLPEPVAIAIGTGRDTEIPRVASRQVVNIVLLHLGGSRFDVSIVSIDENGWRGLATTGIARLGGEDFNDRIIDHLLSAYPGFWMAKSPDDVQVIPRLRQEAERVKQVLSKSDEANLTIQPLSTGQCLEILLTKRTFETINTELFQKINASIAHVLDDAGVKQSDIDEIWFVGDSTKIPKI